MAAVPHARRSRVVRITASDSNRAPQEILASHDLPLIPPGKYRAVILSAHSYVGFGRPKLRLSCDVMVDDSRATIGHRRVRLDRHYNVESRGGRNRAGRSSHYLREWIAVTGRRPARNDRISPEAMRGALVLVEVRTVTHDSRQNELPEAATYSTIGRIISVIAGGGRPHR